MEVCDNDKNIDEQQNKYITVRIEIPIEVFTDGSYTLLDEYLNMEFIQCHSKPVRITEDKKMFLEKYQKMLVDIIASSALSDPVEDFDEESERKSEIEVSSDKITELDSIMPSITESINLKIHKNDESKSESILASKRVILVNPKNVGQSRKRSSNISFKRKSRINEGNNNSRSVLRRFTIKNWSI